MQLVARTVDSPTDRIAICPEGKKRLIGTLPQRDRNLAKARGSAKQLEQELT